jgi:hypothetical protein
MPYYPVPALLGVALNLILAGVLVEYLIRTDPLALILSVTWILLGGVVYVALDRLKAQPDRGPFGGETEITPTAED